MVAALIFVVSLAAAAQFVVLSWRAALFAIAAEPLSDAGYKAMDVLASRLEPQDFRAVSALRRICPDVTGSKSRGMWNVAAYYRILEFIQDASRAFVPTCSAWSEREMAACTRYAAVAFDQQLQSNRVCMAQIQSF